jgi:hypothetical protein
MRAPEHLNGNIELTLSFPASMRTDAFAALSIFPESPHRSETFQVWIEGEIVSIPQRIYHDPIQIDTRRLSVTQRELAHALLTRHADGFVRQSSLSNILSTQGIWIPPFVVQLVGEYVIEIAADIQSALSRLDRAQYGSFIRANPVFLAKTRRRATSYWNCYYRHRCEWKNYPGKQILDFFEVISKTE